MTVLESNGKGSFLNSFSENWEFHKVNAPSFEIAFALTVIPVIYALLNQTSFFKDLRLLRELSPFLEQLQVLVNNSVDRVPSKFLGTKRETNPQESQQQGGLEADSVSGLLVPILGGGPAS